MVMPEFGFLQIVFADYDGRCDSTLKSFYRLSLFWWLMQRGRASTRPYIAYCKSTKYAGFTSIKIHLGYIA